MVSVGDGARPLSKRDKKDTRFRGFLLHIVPLAIFEDQSVIEPNSLKRNRDAIKSVEPLTGSAEVGFNFDGFYTYNGSFNDGDNTARSYLQVFHNGVIEIADSNIFTRFISDLGIGYYFPSPALEKQITYKVYTLLSFYRDLYISAPLALYFSLIGADGYTIGSGNVYHWGAQEHRISQREMLFPEIVINSLDQSFESIGRLLKPAFDRLWNASGVEQCPHYKWVEDKWVPRFSPPQNI